MLTQTQQDTLVAYFRAQATASDVDVTLFTVDITKQPSNHFKFRIFKTEEPTTESVVLCSLELSNTNATALVDTFITAAETFSDDNGGA
jgi:hypothetical protein